jgi:MFS transporter, FLVCR family, disrupted in renal carcinoma protein 2
MPWIAPKWWVLTWYSYLSALQSLLWMTFSSVPEASNAYLGVDDATLNLLLAYGPIAFCICVFPAAALLTSRPTDGLGLSVRLGALMCLTAALLRTIPVAFGSARALPGTQAHTAMLALTHIAQFINAAVGPLIVASPAVLSRLWFPPAQRNTATSIANTANALGRAVGFFLGPAVVTFPTQVTCEGMFVSHVVLLEFVSRFL